jgi:hypothetical protein
VGKKEMVGTESMFAYVESMGLGLEETGSRPWTVYSYKSNSWETQTGIEVRQVSPFGVNALEGVDGVNVDAKRANLLLLKDGVVRLP